MDIKEVEQILDNLRWLQSKMPIAVANWQSTKPNCVFTSGALRQICEAPGKLNSFVFDPLIKWLADYILSREGVIKFQPGQLNDFLRKGLRTITNYVVVADFFSKNPDFFAPNPKISSGTLQQFSQNVKVQGQYRDFLNTLSSKLIGCNDKLRFVFLSLSKTVPNLSPDLKKMQDYLDAQCLSLRVRTLQ